MVKIFRNIRQHLLAKSRFSNYLLYAFGEIILVVMGILIALQIDTLYTNHQLQKTERKYLAEIRNNLKFDLRDIQFNIDFNEGKLRSNIIVLQYLSKEVPYSDTLDFHFSNLSYTTRTLPNSSTYETVKSRGLDIISNDSLRQQITTLYDFYYKNLIDFETKDDHPFQFQVLLPEVIKAIDIVADWREAKPVDQQAILKNHQLKNALTMNIHLREYMIGNYKETHQEVEQTIIQLEKFLDPKNK